MGAKGNDKTGEWRDPWMAMLDDESKGRLGRRVTPSGVRSGYDEALRFWVLDPAELVRAKSPNNVRRNSLPSTFPSNTLKNTKILLSVPVGVS